MHCSLSLLIYESCGAWKQSADVPLKSLPRCRVLLYQCVACCPIKYDEARGIQRAAQHPPSTQSRVGAGLLHIPCPPPLICDSLFGYSSLHQLDALTDNVLPTEGPTLPGWWKNEGGDGLLVVPPATLESNPHYSHSSLLTAPQSRPVFILHLQMQRQPSVGGGKRSSARTGLFRRLLSPFLSLSFLSLSFSYTIRSEVKQATLRWVCSSLTPRLQTNSGQDEGGGGSGKRSHVGEDTLWRWITLLCSSMLTCTVTEPWAEQCVWGWLKEWSSGSNTEVILNRERLVEDFLRRTLDWWTRDQRA